MINTYLFITDKYLPSPTSNGACVANIVEVLRKRGDRVIVLCIYDGSDARTGEDVYSLEYFDLQVSLKDKLFGVFEDQELVRRLFQKATALHNEHVFSAVISVFRPIESVVCGMLLQKRLGIVHIPCFFDIPDTSSMASYKKKIMVRNYQRLYRRLVREGSICVLKYYLPLFLKSIPFKHCADIIPIGIPNLRTVDEVEEPCCKDKRINLIYAGSFYSNLRNPMRVLAFLRCIIGSDVVLHLYSWGCEDVVNTFQTEFGDNIIVHGKVGIAEVAKAVQAADALINVSNDDSFQVPGKIMEYFSTGKPVVNFRYRRDDAGNIDYEKYPLILNIDLFDECSSDQFMTFIKENTTHRISRARILELFPECTPEYFVNIIDSKTNATKGISM